MGSPFSPLFSQPSKTLPHTALPAVVGKRVPGSVLAAIAALGQGHSELPSFRTSLLRFNTSLRSTSDGAAGGMLDSQSAIFTQLQGLCLPCQSTHGKPGKTTRASLGPANSHRRWMRSSGLICQFTCINTLAALPSLAFYLRLITLYLLMPCRNMHFFPLVKRSWIQRSTHP